MLQHACKEMCLWQEKVWLLAQHVFGGRVYEIQRPVAVLVLRLAACFCSGGGCEQTKSIKSIKLPRPFQRSQEESNILFEQS